MKVLLKLLLSLAILIVGVYATTPMWLPRVLSSQLPPGWKLEELQVGYPDFSGISINVVRVTGELLAASLVLYATEVRFTYRGLKTDIGSISLDVYMQAGEESTADTLTLDDLSFPITKLTGQLPELSVRQLHLSIHTDSNLPKDEPLLVDFQAFKLIPDADNHFHLSTQASIEDHPDIHGQIDIDANEHSLNANLRIPADTASPAWITVSIEQQQGPIKSTTLIRAVLDTEAANRQWLDELLAIQTGGMFTHISGKLELRATFSGKELHAIEQLSLASGQLRVEIDGGILTLDSKLLAKREGEKIAVSLPGNAKIEFQDTTGKIAEFIASKVPELQLTSQPDAMLLMEVAETSNFVIHPGKYPAMTFNGDFKLGMNSANSIVNLQASEMVIKITDFSNPDAATINGELMLNWSENAPLTYTLDDGSSAPMTITADAMEIQAQLRLRDGNILSNGNGSFTGGQIQSLATSAAKIDVGWQELDVLKLAGKLTTTTQGFATEFDGELFTGFDFDVAYTLSSNKDVSGSGSVIFDSGIDMPIRFAGNTQAEKWNITLPATSIELAQLGSLLTVANLDMPASVNLTDGYINFQGDIVVDEKIGAEVTIKGYEMGASVLESTASMASFTFEASYGETISARGPLSIKTVALAGGIDISNISVELNLENTETFSLKNLKADVFDGDLFLGDLRYSENRIENAVIELAHVNLGHLLAFADIDGLEGTGQMDISLPAGSDQNGIYIKDGTFKSTHPGRLAYTKEGIAGSNIGLQALENFEYQDLSGTIDYQSDGVYQIGVHLEGRNPDLYGGHPIVFNLNINGSLPELFESLFITGNFEESILKQIRTNQPE